MLYTIKNGELTAKVSSFGAELHSLVCGGTEYIWQAGKAWNRHAPLLFPFICSPSGKKYKAGSREYAMKANHGFARDMEFSLCDSGEDFCEFSLCENEETLSQYPYPFRLTVRYFFENGRLVTKCTVKNTGKENMYFYLGGHPAFNCPLEEGLKFDDYYVEYEQNEIIEQTVGDCMRTIICGENKLPLSRELFDHDVIMKNMPMSESISLKSDKGAKSVTLYYPDSDCIAVWSVTGDNDAAFVCLEPWTSVPVYCDDAFENIEEKPHAVMLESGMVFEYRYDIEVKQGK